MKLSYLILLFTIILFSCSKPLEFQREGYSGKYSINHNQSKLIKYYLTRDCVCPKLKRSSSFNEDSITKSQLLPYYKGSGFDRGHLKPADHSKCSKESMKASFLTLNISPQLPSFNRGPWKQLEAYSKRALNLKDSIQVYVGPIFSRVWNRKKHEGITIPKAYYRTLKFNDSTAVGFIMDQNEKEFDPFRQAVPINLIERKTRLDLYPGTPERFEAKVDSAFLQTLSELSFSGVCE